jgi:hypothetical protein
VRDTAIVTGYDIVYILPAVKVSRQCPLVLPVDIGYRIKALGSVQFCDQAAAAVPSNYYYYYYYF